MVLNRFRKFHVIKVFGFMVLLIFLMMGCSASYDDSWAPDDGQGGDEQPLSSETAPERKIIYTVDVRFSVDDIQGAVTTIRDMLAESEWFDRESISARSAQFTVRVRTERLDAFMAELEDTFEHLEYTRSARDISLDYSSQETRLLAIETEIATLIAMMDLAETFAEILLINERLSSLEVERQDVQGELNRFDSLADYSEVHLQVYERTVFERLPFGDRVGDAFTSGVSALGSFLQGTVIVLAAVLPFALFFGVIGGTGFIVYRRIKKMRPAQPKEDGDRLL